MAHNTDSQATSNDQAPQTPIQYLNLSFDSVLPIPTSIEAAKIPSPDLSKLGSPYKWSPTHKAFVTGVSCIATLFASFAASCYSPGAEQMASEWHISKVAALVGITTFCCGFAIGPMFLAPFSEVVGRKPVFVVTALLLVVCQVCCAVTRLYSGYVNSPLLVLVFKLTGILYTECSLPDSSRESLAPRSPRWSAGSLPIYTPPATETHL